MRSEAATVDAYLAELAPERAEALAALRALIREAAPDAREFMKYGHPHWDLGGPLFALGSQKHHMSLYVGVPGVVEEHVRRLGTRDVGKGCVRFRRLDQLPRDAVSALLRDAAEQRRRAM